MRTPLVNSWPHLISVTSLTCDGVTSPNWVFFTAVGYCRTKSDGHWLFRWISCLSVLFRPMFCFGATCYIACRAYATSMTSVRLSVTSVNCDGTVQRRVDINTIGIGRSVGYSYLHAKADPDRSILRSHYSSAEVQWGMENVVFCGRNGLHVALLGSYIYDVRAWCFRQHICRLSVPRQISKTKWDSREIPSPL